MKLKELFDIATYWFTQGTPLERRPQPPREIIEKPRPQRPIEQVMHSLEHHSGRAINASLQLALLRTDPTLGENPLLGQKAILLQHRLNLHARQLLDEGLPPPAVEKLTAAGETFISAIGFMATHRVINSLDPDEIISMLNTGASPGQIVETGIAAIAHTDYAESIIKRFLQQDTPK